MDSLQQAMLYQAMGQAGANMLNASAPSLDPRSGSLAYALGQGMQGGIQGTQAGIQQYNAIQETKAREEERKRKEALRLSLQKAMSPVQTSPLPLASSIQGLGNYTPQPMPEGMGVQTTPLSQDQRVRDAMSPLLAAGEFESAKTLTDVLKMITPEKKDKEYKEYKEYMYQDAKGEYRKGLFDGVTMVKDLGKATEKDIKYKPEDVDEDAELKARLKIKQLVYGGMGAKYDPISQAWNYPPNFDYSKAQRAEATYLKKRGLVPITGELPFKGDESKHVPLQKKMKPLDKATAAAILSEVGGDKDKARQIAKERGYQF